MDNYLKEMKAQLDSKSRLVELEHQLANKKGLPLNLKSPYGSGALPAGHHQLVDQDYLICEVVIDSSGSAETRKLNSRLDLWSVTNSGIESGLHLAQLAINHTDMWFGSETMVLATGYAETIEESENYGLYKVLIQIKQWNDKKK
ncbi:hypothetical protein EA007_05965 [Vibrio anguillarum]|uniref:hypothetical protein n=1 Tax=Vibrio anguillarum TaxID=55601 RepID=UPI00188C4911|nr:hypothetical protein [Vibrio anguillarum]MBF4250540.1 hypothetical protein [Vibrio anguillarum]